jgi:hypothetical protein
MKVSEGPREMTGRNMIVTRASVQTHRETRGGYAVNTVGLPWLSHSTTRPAESGGARSASNFSLRKTNTLGEPPAEGASTHTITCRCCETTVRVPIRRRFLCDECYRTGC